MANLIAIGVGCRKGATSEAIAALVRRALADAPNGERRLFTGAGKRGEPNLAQAAQALGLELCFIDPARLLAQAPRAVTRSERVTRQIGLPSLAETAALAGAGSGGELILARISGEGATCAVAFSAGGGA